MTESGSPTSEPGPPPSEPGSPPLISLVTPVYNPPPSGLLETIDSVLGQSFEDWQWVLVDDASPDPEILPILRRAAEQDSRIQVIERAENGHIVAASNDGLAAATGRFIALLDHDDTLAPNALELVAEAIQAAPDVDYLYSNEDKINPEGEYFDEFRKPPWSPERLRGQMYTNHLSVLRASLVREVGGFRPGFDGSQDHDLVLRVTERARAIVHIPAVLYHWRVVPGSAASALGAKDYAWSAGRRAVAEHCARVGIQARVALGPVPGTYRLSRRGEVPQPVSVVIPTRGGSGEVFGHERVFIIEAVRALLQRAKGVQIELIVVYDPPTPAEVLAELRALAGPSTKLVCYDKPFNYAEKCNIGAAHATGEYLVMLNDDTQVLTGDFVRQLVAPLREPDVGVTGARLLFEDRTVQHAGVNFSQGGPYHPMWGAGDKDSGPFGAMYVNREVSAVTGACLAIPRSLYFEVGGFSEALPINFNDIDLCFKVAATGKRLLWLAHVSSYHFESKTREAKVDEWEIRRFRMAWGFGEDDDLYFPGAPGPRGNLRIKRAIDRIGYRLRDGLKARLGR